MLKWTQGLKGWYSAVKRDLPWRKSKNPYSIWLSEVILQQTRVAQGQPYYERFMQLFPTVADLAAASEQQVLKAWQGLGYYSRARNLHAAAKQVMTEHQGVFPADYRVLLGLKGIGPYTAAAIASIAFNLPHAVVDGNVYRVLSRVFGLREPIDQPAGQRMFQQLADELLDRDEPGTYNQALMEFGALQCVPVNPDCSRCIFQEECIAHGKGLVGLLPIKVGKVKVRKRYFNYLILKTDEGMYMKQRGGGDIWENMWDFELVESEHLMSEKEISSHLTQKFQFSSGDFRVKAHSEVIKHVLTHQRIEAKFWLVQIFHNLQHKQLKFVSWKEWKQHPLPKLIEATLNKHQEWLD